MLRPVAPPARHRAKKAALAWWGGGVLGVGKVRMNKGCQRGGWPRADRGIQGGIVAGAGLSPG